jgi:alkylation response protein AidB-like acyl-CoA dehydrogenase
MDFNLSKEQLLIQSMARDFAEKHVEPFIQRIEDENDVPREIIDGMAELDLFAIQFPEEWGGSGGGYDGYVLVMEQIARVSPGTSMVLSVNGLGLGAIYTYGTQEQKEKYMEPCLTGKLLASFAFTEPGTGSDPRQITTTAVKDGDSYVINGTKRFISNAYLNGPLVVFARDSETEEITAFIVDKFCEGYSISKPWDKIGLKGNRIVDVYFKDVRVPAENMLGKAGKGFGILLAGIAYGKIGISSTFLGITLRAYEEAVKYATEKAHRGQPIAKFQAIQLRVGELAIKLEAARWLTYRLGCLANDIKNPMQFAKEAALTKSFVCENAVDVTRTAVDVHGSYGVMEDYTIQRLYRDAIIGPQIEGVGDMQKMIVAGSVLR